MLLEAVLGMFGPQHNVAKVRFPTEEDGIRGFGVIRRSGYAVDCYDDDVFGLTSRKQLTLLDEADIPYEIIK